MSSENIYRPDLFSTENEENVFLKKKYKALTYGLYMTRSALRDILSIEGKYNTFQNDAMRRVLETVEKYFEEWA